MSINSYASLESHLGITFTDYQRAAIEGIEDTRNREARACLYFKTGAGKTITALAAMFFLGEDEMVVIAPPSTHAAWEEWGGKFNMTLHCMSHSKFRDPKTKMDRKMPVIADEIHLFGGHAGKGWKKLDRLAGGLQAPLILASATPNYNDAERVYCIQHILEPHNTKGGYLEWLYKHCITRQNQFSMTPLVDGFIHYKDAEAFLASLDDVHYLPDDLEYEIEAVPIGKYRSDALMKFGYSIRNHRMVASLMELRHLQRHCDIVNSRNVPRQQVAAELLTVMSKRTGPVLLFCNHSTIAEVIHGWLDSFIKSDKVEIITGKTTPTEKARIIEDFNAGKIVYLVGTASLATGTDGMDKVCDMLIIVDDTDDDALRRQLIGRIMPRGLTPTKGHSKTVHRLEFL